MTQDEFLAMVARDDGAALVLVTRPPDEALDTHAHPFDARALVLRGELTIAVDGSAQLYRVGDVFHLPCDCAHAERYGPAGVTYLVARS